MTLPVARSTYMCLICGYIYNEVLGAPETGVAPATQWMALPNEWACPECKARRDDFEKVEI